MKSYVYIFLLIVQGRNAFCQQQKHAYDEALRKLSRQSWWYVKSCENDKCNNIDDSTYFYVHESAFKFDRKLLDRINYHTDKILVQVSPTAFRRQRNVVTGISEYVNAYDIVPDFCFVDSSVTGPKFPILTLGEEGIYKAELVFSSETEFIVRRMEEKSDGNVEHKFYFRSRGVKD